MRSCLPKASSTCLASTSHCVNVTAQCALAATTSKSLFIVAHQKCTYHTSRNIVATWYCSVIAASSVLTHLLSSSAAQCSHTCSAAQQLSARAPAQQLASAIDACHDLWQWDLGTDAPCVHLQKMKSIGYSFDQFTLFIRFVLQLRAGGDYKTSVWDAATWKEVATGRAKPFAKHPVHTVVYSGRAGTSSLATPCLLMASDEAPAIWGMCVPLCMSPVCNSLEMCHVLTACCPS